MGKRFDEILEQWRKLGEARSELKERIAQKFALDFNYNSNHIEGNTLTYGQTELLLLFGKVAGDARMRDLEEMKAHNVGLRMVLEEASQKGKPLTESFIRQVHKTLLREDYQVRRQLPSGVMSTYTIHAGRYKTRPNSVITQTGEHFEYASPEETPALMADLLQWYNAEAEKGELSPIELAALFHYRYIRIHPFEDGNGRIARLMVNFILARHGYPMVIVPSKAKNLYLSALNRCDIITGRVPSDGAHASIGQIRPFVDYLEGLAETEMLNDIAIANGGDMAQWWYDGEIVTFKNATVGRILETLAASPKTTIRELAAQLATNKSAIQKHLKTLQGKGYIVRVGGSTRGGEWHVVLKHL